MTNLTPTKPRAKRLTPLRPASAFPQRPGIYLISDAKLTGDDALVPALTAAMQGGVAAVQLREKERDDATILRWAKALNLSKPSHVALLLNRRPHLVAQASAQGVHIGMQELLQIHSIRQQMPAASLVGVSCHSEEDLQLATTLGADFATVGPLVAKVKAPSPMATSHCTLAQVAQWQVRYPLPIYPLGGMDIDRVAQLRALGLQRFACIRAILQAETHAQRSVQAHQLSYELGL